MNKVPTTYLFKVISRRDFLIKTGGIGVFIHEGKVGKNPCGWQAIAGVYVFRRTAKAEAHRGEQ